MLLAIAFTLLRSALLRFSMRSFLPAKLHLGIALEVQPDFLNGIMAALQDVEAVEHDSRIRKDRCDDGPGSRLVVNNYEKINI